MPLYRFKALTPEGKIIKDQAEFPDFRAFYDYLKSEGLVLLKYSTRPALPWDRIQVSKIKRPELAEFCHNLALLIRGGVPLLQALKDLKEATPNKRLKQAITALVQEIMAGHPLSRGMEREKGVFPGIVRSLVSLGEETGRLDETLEEASQHLYRVHTIITQTKRAMLYPTFVLISMTGALLFWLLFVLPKILGLFTQFQVELPLPTRILLAVTEFLRTYILYFAIFFIMFFTFLFFLYRKVPMVRYWLERLSLKVPLIAKIKRSSLLAFFFEYLSLLLGAGIDMLRSFDIIFANIQSEIGKRLAREIKEGILRGESLQQVASRVGLFSPLDLRMIGVGEETGRLVEQLQHLARYYYEIIQGLVETLSKILEPILIFITGIIFLLIVISLIGPIYELMGQIQ